MSELQQALSPRYPWVSARACLYESLYLTAHHPVEAKALWVRHTVQKRPGEAPRASLWCTWFDDGGVRAAKVTTDKLSSRAERPLVVGDQAWMGVEGAAGVIDLDSLGARWELRFVQPEAPMTHLPKPWMYRAPLPRTKSISAAPYLTLAGSLTVDGQAVDITGWPCTIGHNWGAEHADRWLWLHGDGQAPQGPVWLDVVVGRVKVGPLTTPWVANGAISIGGQRHRLGGVRPGAGTRVAERADGATTSLRGKGIRVQVQSRVERSSCVGWIYSDPAGSAHQVVNSSVAHTVLRVERDGAGPLEVDCPASAFEIGAHTKAIDVPLQPFAD